MTIKVIIRKSNSISKSDPEDDKSYIISKLQEAFERYVQKDSNQKLYHKRIVFGKMADLSQLHETKNGERIIKNTKKMLAERPSSGITQSVIYAILLNIFHRLEANEIRNAIDDADQHQTMSRNL